MDSIPIVVLIVLVVLMARDDNGRISGDRLFNLIIVILAIILMSPILGAFFK